MKKKVDIVIPSFNSHATIGYVLSVIEHQSLLPGEVIVVDDGSTDDSVRVVEDFRNNSKLKIVLIKQKNQGPATARNKGAKKAKGDIIVFLDADCKPRKNWLLEMVNPFSDSAIVGVQGTYETWNKGSLIARYVGYEIAFRHEGMKKRDSLDFVGSFSAAYRREVLLKEGGFDTSFPAAASEDQELAARLNERGHRLVFAPKAIVEHKHPETLKKYLIQQFWRGYWRVPVYLKHKEKVTGDSYTGSSLLGQGFLSIIFFLSILGLSAPLFVISFLLLVITNIPFGIYCLKKEGKFIILAPIIASLRSLSGTLGAGYGLVRFKFKKKALS
ncbi:MAG: glycosyltransferase [Candidatus Altiarchaeota archaeon]